MLPHGLLQRRPIRPQLRRARDRGTVESGDGRGACGCEREPDDGGVDGHERTVAADPAGCPIAYPRGERDDRPRTLHLQPDQLQPAVDQCDADQRARCKCPRLDALSGDELQSPVVYPEVHGHDLGKDLAGCRCELGREDPGARRAAGELRESQGRTPQGAALALDDAAESLHCAGLRSEPRQLPRCVGDRVRQGEHAAAAGAVDGSGVFRLPRRGSVPEPRRRFAGLRREGRPDGRDVHLKDGNHELSTFNTIPDVPVTSFELYLPQGPYSALAANGNLCKRSLRCRHEFVAQDGTEIHKSTPIGVTGCTKHKAKAKKASKTKRTTR